MYNNFDGIEEYPNAFPIDWCKQVIKRFKEMSANQLTNLESSMKNQDERIMMDWSNHNLRYHADEDICQFFYSNLNKIYTEKYRNKYESIGSVMKHYQKAMSVQKTIPHHGYHVWHSESADLSSCSRILAYTVYLNDIEEGGETEFLYQGVKIKPTCGKLSIFPTSFTHPHRGNPIYKGEKYIITGWYTLDE